MAGVALVGTAFTNAQAGQLAAALPRNSDRVVVATDADPAGQQAAHRAYSVLTAHQLDPRGPACPPAGMDRPKPCSSKDLPRSSSGWPRPNRWGASSSTAPWPGGS